MLNLLEVLVAVITMTSYNPVPSQTDSDYWITAFNKPVESCTMAISRDLESLGFKSGLNICIPLAELKSCNYKLRIADRLHRRKKAQGDYLSFSLRESMQFGVKKNIVAYAIREDSSCKSLPRRTVGEKAFKLFQSANLDKAVFVKFTSLRRSDAKSVN